MQFDVFLFGFLPCHSAFISICTHPLWKLLFAISNLFTYFLNSRILSLKTLHTASKQCCGIKHISLSITNYISPKAVLIHTPCQSCLKIFIKWELLEYKAPVAACPPGPCLLLRGQFLHWRHALEDPSEVTVWSQFSAKQVHSGLEIFCCLTLSCP